MRMEDGVFKRGGKNAKGPYYATWIDHDGKRHVKSTRTTDKASAKLILAKYKTDAAVRREGVIDSTLESIAVQSRRSVESHLADFEAKMRAENRSEGHISKTLYSVRQICAAAKFTFAVEICADGVNRYAADRRLKGDSSNTVQSHLTSMKGFTKWLAATDKLQRDPLASIKRPNSKADRRYKRRMLLPAEWEYLRGKIAGVLHGMPADARKLLYATAIQTGLRSNELRSLTRSRLFLEGDRPYVTCKASSTKNAKDARQYIQPDLAAELEKHVAQQSPKAPVFALPEDWKMAAMLRRGPG